MRLFTISILSFLTMIFYIPHSQSQTFETTVVGTETTSARPSIFSDPLGHLHVAWVSDDVYSEILRYSTNQSGQWLSRRVAGTTDDVNFVPVIVADKYGFGYISYRHFNGGSGNTVRYVYNKNLTSYYWPVTTQMSWGHFHESSIEVSSNQSTHIFAQEDELTPSASRIFYQNFTLADTVLDNAVQYYSTTIDQNDDLHFVGYRGDNVYYKKYSSGSWSTAVAIDQLSIAAYQPSISCDVNGNMHVAFNTSNGIYYLNDTTGSWSTPVLTTGTGGIFPDVVVDENLKAHIAYNTPGAYGKVYYINNMSGSWSTPIDIATIETDGNPVTVDVTHADSKIALDLKTSTVNIVYVQNTNQVTVSSTDDLELRSSKSTDLTSTLTSITGTPTVDTLTLADESSTQTLLEFTVSDVTGDGEPTKIEELVFQNGPAISDNYCFNDFFQSMSIDVSDATSYSLSLYSSRAIAGTAGSVWKSIPKGGSLTFTLVGVLKSDLGNVMNKNVQVKINGLKDVIIDETGSRFAYSNSDIFSDTLKFIGLNGAGTQTDPYLIENLTDLQTLSKASNYWASYIKQTANIDASSTSSWNSGNGLSPIGISSVAFTGNYDGNGKTISGVFINRGSDFAIGLFGSINGATIQNVGLINANITGDMNTGALIGNSYGSTINYCYSKGSLTGGIHVVGLVGYLTGRTINNSYSTVSVTGTVTRSGGLVGANWTGSQINNCFSSGSVSGGSSNGGLVGYVFNGTTNNCLWDSETSGQASSFGGTGKTTAEMKNESTFADATWDLVGETTNGTDDIWSIDGSNNIGYPWLTWEGYSPVNNIWDGSESTDFMDKDNWSLVFIPNLLNNVIISNGGNQPTLSGNKNVTINDLTLNSGASLTIGMSPGDTSSIIVNDTITNN